MINNRQNGRRRGRGGNNNGGGNGGGGNGPRQGGQGRGDSGNRIDNRARGNASQLLEKYKNLASDAQRQGDRVNTEYYLQFADHYFRVLADQRGRFEDQQPQQRRSQNDFDMDGDDDYGDEGEPIRAGEQQGGSNGNANDGGDDRQRQGNGRGDQGEQRRWEPRGDRDGNRDARGDRDGNRAERDQRDDRDVRTDRQSRNDRDMARNDRDAPRYDREAPRADREPRRPREDQRVEVAGQHRSDPPLVSESMTSRADEVLEADSPAPRKRGRPRRDAGVVAEPREAPVGVDADRLPPSLGISVSAANDADDEPKPRRRRVPRGPVAEAPAE